MSSQTGAKRMAASRKAVLRWGVTVCLLVMTGYEACKVAWLRSGTDVVGTYTSPNGRWQAVVMSCDPGAMGSFSTQVSILPTMAHISRRLAWCGSGSTFIADDDRGAVPSGDKGEIAVTIVWTSPGSLVIKYPSGARVYHCASGNYGIRIECSATGASGRRSGQQG